MAEYIERAKLIEAADKIEKLPRKVSWIPPLLDANNLRYLAEQLPAADVAPVRHGRWNGYVCSVCGVSAEYGSETYCPNCGAKMDLEVDDD